MKELETKEAAMQAKRESFQSLAQQVENLNKQIEMGPQHLHEKLQQTTEARAKAEDTVTQIDADIKKCANLLNATKEKLAQRNVTKRTIVDNIRYREGLSEILALEEDIKKREKHIANTLPQVSLN
jgi:DNA repair exonuclease SbcCD ATPase subunit